MGRKQTVVSSWILRATLPTIAAVLLFSGNPLQAQVDTGSITGTVSDPSSAVISGAKVTLTNEGTSASLTVNTDSDGTYKFTPVRIGTYSLTVSFQGFQTVTQRGIPVNVASALVVNFTLKTGQVTETIEVTEGAVLLETQTSSVGQVVDQRSINNLPLNGRNFTFLAQLGAGINTPQADTRGNAASGAFVANGLRASQNNYLLDGIDNNSDTVDFLNGTNFVVLPPVDAIQEFKVQTTGFSAEFGRSGAAILNATVKSGTNSLHGAAWEFFRNDKLDAQDYFEQKKGALRLNQFGFTVGGPVIRNKVFFFGDYEALRRRQGTVKPLASVPTMLERNSGYTDLSDLLTGGTPRLDALGRSIPLGTVLDPATTRPVTATMVDPVSGIAAVSTGYVRDPFNNGACPASTLVFTAGTCALNHLPAGRLDANAIALLNLYPNPTNNSSVFSNFSASPIVRQNRNAFDTRLDINLSDKNQIFARFSLVDDPQFIPGVFGGTADGGAFQEGDQKAIAQQSVVAWTHIFTPNLVNVARVGLNYLHTSRVSPDANNLNDVPGDFGILGIPQVPLNGGLPTLEINGLSTLGTNGFLPSDEVSSTIQFTDDLTKIYGKHTFKMGMEYQHVKFSTLQPPWSRGDFRFQGAFVDIPGASVQNLGRAQFLLTPIAATVANGIDYAGGPNNIDSSNISLSDNGKNYWGFYINDDWRVTPKLTLNLGLRWDFFGLVYDHYGKQANFVPGGAPTGGPMYLVPPGPNAVFSPGFESLLAANGIDLAVTDKYGKGLGRSQKTNFAPRVGFAYQVTPKLVARAGFGIFYNGFENRGYSPNLGENYPFQFQFHSESASSADATIGPITGVPYTGCATATPAGSPTLETGLSCHSFDPLAVAGNGLNIRGIQFEYITPYSMGGNLTVQYEVAPSMSVQAAYVTTQGRHLEVFPNTNNVSEILPKSLPVGDSIANYIPFPDFQRGLTFARTIGNSTYNGLQLKAEKRFGTGLNFLATYTWSQARTNARDLLNSSGQPAYRAPDVPGFGIGKDYGLSTSDIRNVFHLSGGYELPFGKGKRFMADVSGPAKHLVGGWSIIWSAVLQGGQPFVIPCPTSTTNATACTTIQVAGQDLRASNPGPGGFLNPNAFTQPCVLGGTPGATAPIPNSPAGCVPLDGFEALGFGPVQIAGPTFKRLELSTFKDFPISERFRVQFRAEFFNILNHPNFNAPGFGGNGVVSVPGSLDYNNPNFGKIGSTRDAPNDPRQIQFALKLYY